VGRYCDYRGQEKGQGAADLVGVKPSLSEVDGRQHRFQGQGDELGRDSPQAEQAQAANRQGGWQEQGSQEEQTAGAGDLVEHGKVNGCAEQDAIRFFLTGGPVGRDQDGQRQEEEQGDHWQVGVRAAGGPAGGEPLPQPGEEDDDQSQGGQLQKPAGEKPEERHHCQDE